MLNFMNKKANEMTGLETMKFSLILTAMLSGMTYGIMFIALRWSDIVDWFDEKRNHFKIAYSEDANLEEDELS